MHILIIEDEYTLAELIKEKLTKDDYIVDIETDGEEGYYNALSGLYDLIILDVMLPSMNGFEILKKLREEEIESKVIMLTAKSMLEDKLNGLENGADDYLTKPFHIEELYLKNQNHLLDPEIQAQTKGYYVPSSPHQDQAMVNTRVHTMCRPFY